MAGCDHIRCAGFLDLSEFQPAVFTSLFLVTSCLEKSAATTAAVVVGLVRVHIDKIFLTDHSLDHVTQVFGNGIAQGFSYQLAGILNGELNLQVLVPV
jgi:hypothetical protein